MTPSTPAVPAFSGAVLAGGRSRRMGRDKAFLEIDQTPMVVLAQRALRAAGAMDIRITGGDTARLEALGLTVDDDPVPFAGPLAALITSLEHAHHDTVMVLSCDLPDPSADAVRATVMALQDADAAVPTDGDQPQWLHGVWTTRCLPTLRTAYAAGERAIRRAMDGLDVRIIAGIDPVHLTDADRPGDLPATAYPAPMDFAEIDIEAFARRREQGVPLLDVRQPEEYEEAHVPGAVLIPLDELPDRLDEVPEGDLHIICKTGGRSGKAAEFLAAQGVQATNVMGGTQGWIEAGHPVDGGAGSA